MALIELLFPVLDRNPLEIPMNCRSKPFDSRKRTRNLLTATVYFTRYFSLSVCFRFLLCAFFFISIWFGFICESIDELLCVGIVERKRWKSFMQLKMLKMLKMLHPLFEYNKCRWIAQSLLQTQTQSDSRERQRQRGRRWCLSQNEAFASQIVYNWKYGEYFHSNVRPSDEFVPFRYSKPHANHHQTGSFSCTNINFATPVARVLDVCLRTILCQSVRLSVFMIRVHFGFNSVWFCWAIFRISPLDGCWISCCKGDSNIYGNRFLFAIFFLYENKLLTVSHENKSFLKWYLNT